MDHTADHSLTAGDLAFAESVRLRRKALIQRLAMAFAAAMVFSEIIGWNFLVVWMLGYCLIQLVDMVVFGPIVAGKTDRLPFWRMALGCVAMFVNAAGFGILSLPLWQHAGVAGGVCAVMLICGGAVYSVINAASSLRALIVTLSPQIIYLGLTPVFLTSIGAPTVVVTASAIAALVLAGYCVGAWRRLDEARKSEADARVEADRKRAEAERLMDSRQVFLASIGHDLRTPISAIMAGASVLERADDAASRSHARLITDAGVMMKAMLDDLLDHAKLESGHMTVDVVDFSLRDLLNQTARLWRGPATEKGLKLRVEGAATVPASVRGDPLRLRQVMNNLISNAMKFTETGSVTLRCRCWVEDDGRHAVVIEIADTGPGMTAEQQSRLFRPFDQTAEGVSARYGGTGLGLAISRQLVDLMGGRVTVRSREGQGSAFTLALHLDAGEAVAAAPVSDQDSREAIARAALGARPADSEARAPAPRALEPVAVEPEATEAVAPDAYDDEERPLSVLIVDDHDINRRAIELILQPLGCVTATAADGLSALAQCDTTAFDLIFMDVRMPELDGRETTRRLRAGTSVNADTPVIAVTADTSAEDIAACNAAGMTYFVPKPITPAVLIGAVQHVLSGGVAEDQDLAADAA